MTGGGDLGETQIQTQIQIQIQIQMMRIVEGKGGGDLVETWDHLHGPADGTATRFEYCTNTQIH